MFSVEQDIYKIEAELRAMRGNSPYQQRGSYAKERQPLTSKKEAKRKAKRKLQRKARKGNRK